MSTHRLGKQVLTPTLLTASCLGTLKARGWRNHLALRETVVGTGIPIGSQLFVEKVQQNLDLRRQARWTGEKRAKGDRFRSALPQNGQQSFAWRSFSPSI